MDNNNHSLSEPYDNIDSILEKNEEDINKLLQQLDALNDIEGFANLMDFDEEYELVANQADYADILPAQTNEDDTNDYRFN
ncbi:hypothetical protein H0A36_13220 [Endozoicomonas sp. SM1973]|uniref:Uncharacterized protein n=1 Tax=Spartinivicinus marinus TaxID=2994442 RepID=A0A853IHC2_9GAMM|nr:hypothetical protein [Spartinivicinus marinus]MCX4029643.1 hypothetical protein [Spartinivicinus marinus]NYZ66976.1 hypothetical protein [Spartinivicinus marinus]